MSEELGFDYLTLKTIRSIALAADPESDDGAALLRMAVSTLLSIDAWLLKEQGTRLRQVRLLPPWDLLLDDVGLRVESACDLVEYEGFTDKGRADSYFFVDELRQALSEGRLVFQQASGRVEMRANRTINRSELQPLTKEAERYAREKSRIVNDVIIEPFCVTFSMPALKRFVVKVCDAYLKAIGEEQEGS